MMEKLLVTDTNNKTALIARVALGIVIFPHGAQKLFGWFGGHGFEGTMSFFTDNMGIPWMLGLLVILIEFFGSLFLIAGFLTRATAFAVIGTFIGIVVTSHADSGFFMNWAGQANQREGLEYFLLLFALALISVIAGGGKASVDGFVSTGDRHERRSEEAMA